MYQKHDADFSIRNFEKFTVPALRKCFGLDAQIVSFERRQNPFEAAMDNCGIDGGVAAYDGRPYFFSSRVQRDKGYKSFSIRYERPNGEATEFAKWQHAMQTHKPMPNYHFQAFVDSDEKAATVAVARTVELIQFCERRNPKIGISPTCEKFYVVSWRELERGKILRISANGQITQEKIR